MYEFRQNLTVQDEPNKLLLINPVNSVNHDQARKNPPWITYLEQSKEKRKGNGKMGTDERIE